MNYKTVPLWICGNVRGLFTITILFISAGQMLNIGGQTVRLATPGGTLLKAGSTLTGNDSP